MPKDFSHQDLRGRSFKSQDLTGADFSHADIRGANFKGAILKGANFANAKGGLTKYTYSIMIILILSIITGFFSGFSGAWMAEVIKWILQNFKADTISAIIIYTLLYYSIYIVISIIFIQKQQYTIENIIIIMFIVGSVAGSGAGALALALVISLSLSVSLALSSYIIIGIIGAICIAGIGYIAGSLCGSIAERGNVAEAGFVVSIIQILLSCYISYRTYQEDNQFDIFRKYGILISSLFGADFDGAELTDANLTNTNLKHCRFGKETIILRTNFQNAENLKIARLTGTILENKAVRELLVTGNGKNQSYTRMNLKRAYLVGADLRGADFHEADLIGATLENANLRDANLSRIQALGVEFRGADFTGACLESWNIDATTQLDGANADYVYLLSDKQERRPASGTFGQGEFAKLFNEVLDTVDFIFRNGIDWQAFMVSFDNLREKIRIESDNDDISIQSITNKGDGVFVVKVNVPPHTDKSEFHSDFTKEYDTNLKLIEAKYHAQLEAKDREIAIYREKSTDFKEIITVLASRPIEVKAEAKIDDSRKTDIHGNVNHSTVIAGDENDVN